MLFTKLFKCLIIICNIYLYTRQDLLPCAGFQIAGDRESDVERFGRLGEVPATLGASRSRLPYSEI